MFYKIEKTLLIPVIILALCQFPAMSIAQVPDSEVHFNYTHNFLTFISWENKKKDDKLNFCSFGNDSFSKIRGVEKYKKYSSIKRNITLSSLNSRDCDIIFIPYNEERNLRKIIAQSLNQPILTVSDIPSFTKKGGMIGFIKEENSIKFQINVNTARVSGITISSKLAEIAKK